MESKDGYIQADIAPSQTLVGAPLLDFIKKLLRNMLTAYLCS